MYVLFRPSVSISFARSISSFRKVQGITYKIHPANTCVWRGGKFSWEALLEHGYKAKNPKEKSLLEHVLNPDSGTFYVSTSLTKGVGYDFSRRASGISSEATDFKLSAVIGCSNLPAIFACPNQDAMLYMLRIMGHQSMCNIVANVENEVSVPSDVPSKDIQFLTRLEGDFMDKEVVVINPHYQPRLFSTQILSCTQEEKQQFEGLLRSFNQLAPDEVSVSYSQAQQINKIVEEWIQSRYQIRGVYPIFTLRQVSSDILPEKLPSMVLDVLQQFLEEANVPKVSESAFIASIPQTLFKKDPAQEEEGILVENSQNSVK